MISDVIRALRRRWYVLLAGVLLTIGLAYGVYSVTPPQYTARGLVLLLPSATSVGPGGNPFLNLSGLEQPASIVVAYFDSTTAHEDIASRAPNAEFEVVIDASTRGPVIAITVTDKNSEATMSALTYIAGQIPVQLQRLQQDVDAPPDAMIHSMPLVIDEEPQASIAGTIRLVIAAVVVGLVGTGIVAFMLDGVLLTRRHRRDALGTPEAASVLLDPKRTGSDSGRRTRMAVSPSNDAERPGQPGRVTTAPASARTRRES